SSTLDGKPVELILGRENRPAAKLISGSPLVNRSARGGAHDAAADGKHARRRQRSERDAGGPMRTRRLKRRETTAEGSPAAGARRTEEHHARRSDRPCICGGRVPWPVAALDAEEARAARHRPDARAHLRVGGAEPAVDRRPSDEPSRLLARPEQPGGGGRVEARDLVRNGRNG